MNITIIYHSGIRDDIKEFYRGLSRFGFQVTAIVPRKVNLSPSYVPNQGIVSSRDKDLLYNLIPIDLLNINNYNMGFHPWQLAQALKQSLPDIIHVFNEYHSWPVTQVIFTKNFLFKKEIPIFVYVFQNIDYLNFKNIFQKSFFKNCGRKITAQYNIKYITGATGANSEALGILNSHNRNILVKKIFWGIDLNKFFPQDKLICRTKLNLPKDAKIIGYFGRMEKEKGLEDLLKATAALGNTFLLLLGDGGYSKVMNRLIKKLSISDWIIWREFITTGELNSYYNALDCFVLASHTTPTWKEQYGRVLVEAMACGIPIVGSNSGAIPEILGNYSKSLIFQERNLAEFIQCIDQFLRHENGKICPLDALESFSIKNFIRQHVDFYNQIIARV